MEILTIAMQANQTRVFDRAGRYFEVIEAERPLSVWFYDQHGGRVDDMLNARSGFFIEEPFSRFEVFSASAQAVRVMVTERRGGSRRQPGDVAVIESLSSQISTTRGGMNVTGATITGVSQMLVDSALAPQGIELKAFTMTGFQSGIPANDQWTGYLYAAPTPAALETANWVGAIVAEISVRQSAVRGEQFAQAVNRRMPPGWSIYIGHLGSGGAGTGFYGATVSWQPVQ